MICIMEDEEFAKALWIQFRNDSVRFCGSSSWVNEDTVLTWEQLPKGMQDAFVMAVYAVRRDERRIIQEKAMWSTWQRIKAMFTRKKGV